MTAALTITEFTDPGCPFAFSAEPLRWRLRWIYGDQLDWRLRMVGLAETAADYEDKGFTPERQSDAFAKLSGEHHMPIDTSLRPRMAATVPACRAVVAARLHAPEAERALLRNLRVRHFSGELLDAPETIDGAAVDAGLDPAELTQWTESPAVDAALAEDMRLSRHPTAAALAQDDKLGDWPGGRRYTCPSYEFDAAGETLAAPGFQPAAVYDVALANLLPEADRRDPPATVEELLRWAGTPLATQEVAVVCGLDFNPAREALGHVAVERHVGWDGFWSLA
jgi:predicted DsbA family dithiol-disulfide isomerase